MQGCEGGWWWWSALCCCTEWSSFLLPSTEWWLCGTLSPSSIPFIPVSPQHAQMPGAMSASPRTLFRLIFKPYNNLSGSTSCFTVSCLVSRKHHISKVLNQNSKVTGHRNKNAVSGSWGTGFESCFCHLTRMQLHHVFSPWVE